MQHTEGFVKSVHFMVVFVYIRLYMSVCSSPSTTYIVLSVFLLYDFLYSFVVVKL